MKISVLRKIYSDICTIGELYIEDDFECFTLEDCMREVVGSPVETWKIPGKTAIPQGTYEVIMDMSQRFHKVMPHILDVPGFVGIRIHPLNNASQTEGCIGIGKRKYNDSIAESRVAYEELIPKIRWALHNSEKVYIEVKNG